MSIYILRYADERSEEVLGVFSTYEKALNGIIDLRIKLGNFRFMERFLISKSELNDLEKHIKILRNLNSEYILLSNQKELTKKQSDIVDDYSDAIEELLEIYSWNIVEEYVDVIFDIY